MDLERLRKDKDKRVKLLKEREKKISEQGKDLERAIETLNSKLKEEDSPKLLNVRERGTKGLYLNMSTMCNVYIIYAVLIYFKLPLKF